MAKLIWVLLIFVTSTMAWAGEPDHALKVQVNRKGDLYTLIASFDTSPTKCAAYHYLTDYAAAGHLPGVIKSVSYRLSANNVEVDRIADNHILFFNVRLHSVIEYTEQPFDHIEFAQLKGDSKAFRGSWDIVQNQHGSTLKFRGLWEPDTMIPLFIIDYFAKNGLAVLCASNQPPMFGFKIGSYAATARRVKHSDVSDVHNLNKPL